MGAKRRMRTAPVSIEVINIHNRHDGTTYPELREEQARMERERKQARQRKQQEAA